MSKTIPIDYVEFGAGDLDAIKQFYQSAFGWQFTDYGPDYTSFSDGRIAGGFSREAAAGVSPLVVLRAEDLEASFAAVKDAGGVIAQDIFSFPGGRRFHFRDPGGNMLAVWGE